MDWTTKQAYRSAVESVARGLAGRPTPTERAALEHHAAGTRSTPWSGPGISVRTTHPRPRGARFKLSLFIKTDSTDRLARKGWTR